MQDRELDELVARIGDALLARLSGGAPSPAPPAANSVGCLCDHGDASQSADFRPPAEWARRSLEVACLDGRATTAEVEAAAAILGRLDAAALTVLPAHVKTATRALRGSSTRTVAVVGYPHGGTPGPLKLAEAELALGQGAREIEWTAPLGALREGLHDLIYGELLSAVTMARAAGAELSFAFETGLLEERDKLTAAALGRLAGVDAVVVTAGRSAHGQASPQDVALIKRTLDAAACVKAAGGVTSWAAVGALTAAGADRIVVDDTAVLTL